MPVADTDSPPVQEPPGSWRDEWVRAWPLIDRRFLPAEPIAIFWASGTLARCTFCTCRDRVPRGGPLMAVDRSPLTARSVDRADLEALEKLVQSAEPVTLSAGNTSVIVPEPIRSIVEQAAHELARGNRVSLLPVGRLLTTRQAAELLNVSRPFLIKLLDAGEIGFEMVGTHRRVPIDDLLRYRETRSRGRRDALRELSEDADDLGIYTD
jgi:excisionase family DNA binding protein